jgi:hypothetical protein
MTFQLADTPGFHLAGTKVYNWPVWLRCGRSAIDGQGRSYPLTHLRYAKEGAICGQRTELAPPAEPSPLKSPHQVNVDDTRTLAFPLQKVPLIAVQIFEHSDDSIRMFYRVANEDDPLGL